MLEGADPVVDGLEAVGLEPVQPLAAPALDGDHADASQDGEVLRNGGLGKVKQFNKPAHRARARRPGKGIDNPPPPRLRDGVEDVSSGRCTGHRGEYIPVSAYVKRRKRRIGGSGPIGGPLGKQTAAAIGSALHERGVEGRGVGQGVLGWLEGGERGKEQPEVGRRGASPVVYHLSTPGSVVSHKTPKVRRKLRCRAQAILKAPTFPPLCSAGPETPRLPAAARGPGGVGEATPHPEPREGSGWLRASECRRRPQSQSS